MDAFFKPEYSAQTNALIHSKSAPSSIKRDGLLAPLPKQALRPASLLAAKGRPGFYILIEIPFDQGVIALEAAWDSSKKIRDGIGGEQSGMQRFQYPLCGAP
jgi:hypothetical protein